MQWRDGTTLFSAGDLVNFMGCAHATALDVRQLVTPVAVPHDDEHTKLLQEKGFEHEATFLARLKAEQRTVIEIVGDGDIVDKTARTRAALREGADVIYQGAFLEQPWQGYSDFLLRVDRPSALGDFSYEVADTKLSRSAKPKHLIQMCIYSDILAREQGIAPERMHVVLGDGTVASVRVDSVIHYFNFARERFLDFATTPPEVSAGSPCGHCTFCHWATACDAEWEAMDHLSRVAGLTRGQADALRAAGITDLVELAGVGADVRVVGVQPETLDRLRHQARLQAHQRQTGSRIYELLPAKPRRGVGPAAAARPRRHVLRYGGRPAL